MTDAAWVTVGFALAVAAGVSTTLPWPLFLLTLTAVCAAVAAIVTAHSRPS